MEKWFLFCGGFWAQRGDVKSIIILWCLVIANQSHTPLLSTCQVTGSWGFKDPRPQGPRDLVKGWDPSVDDLPVLKGEENDQCLSFTNLRSQLI